MRKNKNIADVDSGIATEIMHIYRRLLQRGAQAMERMNIGVGQVPILKLLSDHGTMTQRQIAEEIRVTPATICGTIKRMEKAGLIQRTADKLDGRVTCISLTDEGSRRTVQALNAVEQAHQEMMAGFSESERRVLHDFLMRMGQNLVHAVETSEEEEGK